MEIQVKFTENIIQQLNKQTKNVREVGKFGLMTSELARHCPLFFVSGSENSREMKIKAAVTDLYV